MMMMMGFDLERGWSPGGESDVFPLGQRDCPQSKSPQAEKWPFWVLDANIVPEHFWDCK